MAPRRDAAPITENTSDNFDLQKIGQRRLHDCEHAGQGPPEDPTAEKGTYPRESGWSNGPTSCADRLIVLTLLPLRVQIRTRVSSGPDLLLELCPAVLHGGALFMTCVRRVSECHRKEPRAARRFSIRVSSRKGCWSAAPQPASLNGLLFGSKRDRKIAASIGSWKQ